MLDHYLTGDITRDLRSWMRKFASPGWRSGDDHNPSQVYSVGDDRADDCTRLNSWKILRLQTSPDFSEDYPRFSRQNVSHDFWAPGFSLVPGNIPQSADDINNFIMQIRRQQGIY
ncbi:MAG: hypothetical protein IPO22_24610 [Anaerolineales bacterium]|nr:hypothetical protein [Anaerolineales bacterium]